MLGYHGSGSCLYEIRDWLREKHRIHVEVGSIWDELNNEVESYFFSISAPVNIYYFEPYFLGGGSSHSEVLKQGVLKGLNLLKEHKQQNSLSVNDDRIVLAYLKGYGDKKEDRSRAAKMSSSIEKYAYQKGRMGDYMEEGFTDDDIVRLVRNETPFSHRNYEQEIEQL